MLRAWEQGEAPGKKISDWLSVSANICSYTSDYQNIDKNPYQCSTTKHKVRALHCPRVTLLYSHFEYSFDLVSAPCGGSTLYHFPLPLNVGVAGISPFSEKQGFAVLLVALDVGVST